MNEVDVVDNLSLESLVGRVADEFIDRIDRGEQPDVEEYAGRYPKAAAVLREVLRALQLVRASGPPSSGASQTGELLTAGHLGDFRIVREVGRGGMGVVYEAEQVSLGRRVALKVLPFAAALDSKQLQRFKNEAQAAAHLHHSSIVPVYAVGCERGMHFYAMQFIEGQTLATVIAELRSCAGPELGGAERAPAALSEAASVVLTGPWIPKDELAPTDDSREPSTSDAAPSPTLPAPSATLPKDGISTERSTQSPAFFRNVAQLGLQATEALEHAHQLGIIHRDIKPANLLVDGRGNLWVTDFGLAHCQSQVGLTMSGDLVGTLRYMSPEQALARRLLVDHRTDIYSLGVTLYELLTLEPPFAGSDRHELLRQIAFEEPKPPRRLNRAIPDELETIILKAVEKNPADRYATAQDLADDLRRFLNNEPIRAKRATMMQRARKWAVRHRGVALMGVVLLALAAVGSSIATLLVAHQRDLAEERRQEAVKQRTAALNAQAQAERAESMAKEETAKAEAVNSFLRSLLTSGRSSGFQSPNTTLAQFLERAVATLDSASHNAAAGPIMNPAVEASVRLTIGNTYVQLGMYAEAERHLRRGLELRQKVLAEPSDPWGREYAETAFALKELGLVLRELGKSAESELFMRQGRQARRRSEIRRIRCVVNASPYTIHMDHTVFSPDSRRLLAGGDDNCLRLFDVATGVEIHRFAGSAACAFSPDGRYILSVHNKTLRLWDTATAKELRQFQGHSDGVAAVAFSADGRQAVSAGGNDKTIRLWDVQTGKEVRQFLGHTGSVIQAVYSPDGRWVLSAAYDGTVRLWDVATGTEIRRFLETGTAFPAIANPLAFSPDGRRIFVAYGNGLRSWDAETGQEVRFIPHLNGFDAVALTPDGKRVLTSDASEGRLRLWDVDTGTELRSFYIDVGLHPRHVQVSPDGRFAACGNWRGSLSIWRLDDQPPQAGEDVTEARQLYENSIRDRGPHHPETMQALDEWAALLTDDGRFAEAEPLFRWSLESKKRSLGADHADTLAAMRVLAGVLVSQGKLVEAEPLLRECREGHRRVQGVDHPDVLLSSDFLADVLDAQSKPEESEDLCRECWQGWRRLLGPEHQETRAALHKLTSLLQRQGKPAEAAPLVRQLLKANLSARGLGDPDTLRTINELVSVLGSIGRVAEAEEVYRQVIDQAIDQMPVNAALHNNLAWLLATCPEAKLRNPGRAVELAKKAVGLAPKQSAYRNTLGVAHYRMRNWKEAIEELNMAESLAPGKTLAWNAFFLAMAHWQLGDKEKARHWYDRAVSWMEKNKPNDEELRRFRNEAEELLQIQGKKTHPKEPRDTKKPQ